MSAPTEPSLVEELELALTRVGTRFQTKSSVIGSGGLKLILRIHDESSWIWVVALLLREERRQQTLGDPKWRLHICQQYMALGDGRLGYTWNFQLWSEALRDSVLELCRFLDMATVLLEHRREIQVHPTAPIPNAGRSQPASPGKPRGGKNRNKIGGEVVNGEVVSYPLEPHSLRVAPEGKIGEAGKRQKGAHLVRTS